jgi:hypothetical protein
VSVETPAGSAQPPGESGTAASNQKIIPGSFSMTDENKKEQEIMLPT